MHTARVSSMALLAATAAAALALAGALPHAQAPNASQLVTQTVAGVKFGTLPGFVIERVNPPDKTDSYVMLTFDSAGRPVVSKEQDHPRLLLDEDRDGVFEGEKVITDKIRNCQGLWFDGRTLYGACTDATVTPPPAAPGTKSPPLPAGIFRLEDRDGDDVMDTFEKVTATVGSIAEHGPHALRRAPDGSFSFMSGNDATIVDEHFDEGSLVRHDKDVQLLPYLPNFGRSVRQGVHSGVYRWDPQRRHFTVLFGGNRNAYDHAYNLDGEAFLFDSDMEWDINMPWYREVRTVHGIPGGNYGYRDGSGKYPAWYLDSLPPVRDVGRGSPVGVEFYTSYAYPREFFDTLFEADWSRGRLLYTELTPEGATYRARGDRAEFVHGEPFNITDVETGPDGLLYFTTGGRNTSGGVWRLRYTGAVQPPPDLTGILAVVRQPQPLSSWGWAAIERVRSAMGDGAFASALERLARDPKAQSLDRMRAVYEMQRHGAAPSPALLKTLAADSDPRVRAAAVYVAGVQGGAAAGRPDAQAAVAAGALKDADPAVRRRAAEALVRMGQSPERPSLAPAADIYALLNDADRFVRWAGRLALERTARGDWKDLALRETNPLGAIESVVALVNTAGAESLQPLVDKQLGMLKDRSLSLEHTLRLLRALQYTVTQMPSGLSPAEREGLHGLLVGRFPAADERLNRELALLLAYAGQPQAISMILSAVPAGDTNQPLQLHYLYALRAIREGWTADQKVQLAELLGRASTWRGGAQFANFVGQMFDAVQPLFATAAEQELLYAKAPDFSPLTPEQIAEIQAKAAASGRGGGRGTPPNPLAARRQGRVISRQEMLEEAVFQPQQKLDVADGRAVFETSCASCHRFGSLGTDHGMPSLDLTGSRLLASKYALLEAVMLPDRTVAPEHETTVLSTADGRTIRGLLLRETNGGAALLAADGTVAEIPTSQVTSRRKERVSLMSEAMADKLGQTRLRNLAAFLTTAPQEAGQATGR